jgi:hypothetical protein
MIIETKFNPEDVVWIMKNNKPLECKIYEVIPGTIAKDRRYKDKYTTYGFNGNSPFFHEEEIFRTKEELINSL